MILSWPEIHGAVTHFPVALLMAGAFFEVLAHLSRSDKRRAEWWRVSFWMLVVSVVTAVPSLLSGYITGREVFGSATPPQIFNWHWMSAVVTSVLAAAVLGWRLRTRDELSQMARRVATLVVLFASLTVGYTGYLGGKMVFGDERVEEARDTVGRGDALVQDKDERRGRGRGGERGEANANKDKSDMSTQNAPDTKLVALGQEVYAEARCRNCHRIGDKGRTSGPDLTHVGKRLPDLEWHIKHLKNPQSVRPDSTMPAYDKLSEEKLRALSAYIISLK